MIAMVTPMIPPIPVIVVRRLVSFETKKAM
jgi:hypothetical protein